MGKIPDVKEETSKENIEGSKANDGSAVRTDGSQEKGQEERQLLTDKAKERSWLAGFRMGDRIFYRYQEKVFPAIITSDGIKMADLKVQLCYIDGSSGRQLAVNNVSRGLKDKEWWHDSRELLAAIEFERQRVKTGI